MKEARRKCGGLEGGVQRNEGGKEKGGETCIALWLLYRIRNDM